MNKPQRIVFRLTLAGFAAFGLAIALYFYLMRVSPTSPDLSRGQICEMNEHGYVFFVTAYQRFTFFALLGLFALLAPIATFLGFARRDSRA